MSYPNSSDMGMSVYRAPSDQITMTKMVISCETMENIAGAQKKIGVDAPARWSPLLKRGSCCNSQLEFFGACAVHIACLVYGVILVMGDSKVQALPWPKAPKGVTFQCAWLRPFCGNILSELYRPEGTKDILKLICCSFLAGLATSSSTG